MHTTDIHVGRRNMRAIALAPTRGSGEWEVGSPLKIQCPPHQLRPPPPQCPPPTASHQLLLQVDAGACGPQRDDVVDDAQQVGGAARDGLQPGLVALPGAKVAWEMCGGTVGGREGDERDWGRGGAGAGWKARRIGRAGSSTVPTPITPHCRPLPQTHRTHTCCMLTPPCCTLSPLGLQTHPPPPCFTLTQVVGHGSAQLDDCVERRAQLMAHHRDEVILGEGGRR